MNDGHGLCVYLHNIDHAPPYRHLQCRRGDSMAMRGLPHYMCLQDTIPAENSVISMLMKANNKATGTSFTHL